MFAKGHVITKGKGEGYNKPRVLEAEGTGEPKGGKEQHAPGERKQPGKGFPPALSVEHPLHSNALKASDTWLPSLLYPLHLEQSLARQRRKADIWWLNEVHRAVTGFFRGWAHRSFLPPPPFPLYKKFSDSLWACWGLFKRQIVLPLLQRTHRPPSIQNCLSVLVGTGGTACFARNLHRKWCNLGCFSAFSTSFPKLKKEM